MVEEAWVFEVLGASRALLGAGTALDAGAWGAGYVSWVDGTHRTDARTQTAVCAGGGSDRLTLRMSIGLPCRSRG